MADDWFRSPLWTETARTDFESRLARARARNRAQYLRIKGLALADAGEIVAARALWQRVLTDKGEFAHLESAGALEHLGDSYAREDPIRAEHYYRRLLDEHPSLNGTTAMQHVKLAELLIRRRQAGDLQEAADLLTHWAGEGRVPFPGAHFRWNVAMMSLAEATGDRPTARDAARRALDLAGSGPVFSRHKDVGVVRADRHTMKKLRRIAN
ncbi:hypothetical protein [Microbacterium sp. LWH3-1.2]|uniref:hypothetical protein n=1 Tax=Microbacterium sp. LWH3-1.2 TaxID=3135256 RepID=UPI003440BDF3